MFSLLFLLFYIAENKLLVGWLVGSQLVKSALVNAAHWSCVYATLMVIMGT